MKLTISIKKTHLFVLMFFIGGCFLGLYGVVYAYNSGGPNSFVGHTYNELPKYIGSTQEKYNGSMGGYAEANAKCVAEFGQGARMCTASDFANGETPQPNSWYSSFLYLHVGGVYVSLSSDCNGWTSDEHHLVSGKYLGGPVFSTLGYPAIGNCGRPYPIACCK